MTPNPPDQRPGKPPNPSWTQTLKLIPEISKQRGIRLRSRMRGGLWIGLASALIVLLLWLSGAFASVRLRLQDVSYITAPTSNRITIVAIDDESLQVYGRSPALWSRALYADLIDRLTEAGARVIAFDILFAESTDDDPALLEAMQRAQEGDSRVRIVMPIVGIRRADELAASSASSGMEQVVEYDDVLRPQAAFVNQVDMLGYVNVYPDIDHTVRRYLSMVRLHQPEASDPGATQTGLSFSLAAYLAYLRIPQSALAQVMRSGEGTLQITPERSIHVDSFGLWMPYFFGQPSTTSDGTFPVISMWDVLNETVDPALFADRIVMVGVINSTGFNDLHAVPSATGRLMAGIEIHANAIESLLQGVLPVEQPAAGQAMTILLLAVGAALIYSLLRWYAMLIAAPLLVIAWIIVAFVWFQTRMELINLFHTSLAILVPAVAALGWNIVREVERRQRGEWLLTQVSALYSETRRQKAMLEALIAGSPVGILVLDGAGAVTRGNAAVETALGVTINPSDHAAPRRLEDLLKDSGLSPEDRVAVSLKLRAGEAFRLDINHGSKHYILDGAPLELPSDSAGKQNGTTPSNGTPIGGWILTLNDVTALQELSNLKTRMIRMTSHDLKNPLTIIFVIGKLLLETGTLSPYDPRMREYIERILNSAQTMNEIIDHILKMERAKAGEIEREPVHVGEIADVVVRQQRTQIESKRQILDIDIARNLPYVKGDAQQLTQAVANLISNASKYTPDGGRITVRVYRTGMGVMERVHIDVQDNGFGIPKDAQARLFQEFYRVQTQDTMDIPGTGLGLSLVKSVIEAHGGRVTFISEEGKGSTFYVELPATEDEREKST